MGPTEKSKLGRLFQEIGEPRYRLFRGRSPNPNPVNVTPMETGKNV